MPAGVRAPALLTNMHFSEKVLLFISQWKVLEHLNPFQAFRNLPIQQVPPIVLLFISQWEVLEHLEAFSSIQNSPPPTSSTYMVLFLSIVGVHRSNTMGVCLGDGQTEAEGVPWQGGRGDALLLRMPPYRT